MRSDGLAWLSAYVVLAVVPAGVAIAVDPFSVARPALVELSAGLGLIAVPVVLMQFALVSRLRGASRPFGTDALVQFHRYMGFLALTLVIAHPLLLTAVNLSWSAWSPLSGDTISRTGAVALWALVILVVTTVLRRRVRLSYETWQIVHLALAITAVTALVLHVRAVSGYTATRPVAALLAVYLLASAAVLAAYRLVRPLRLRSRPWVVVDNVDQGASTRTLRVCPVGHPGFAFEPGQFAWLITGASPFSRQQHPLSMSSSAEWPADGAIEFSVKELGDWSRDVVPHLSPGARVWVEGPFGAFSPEGKSGQGFVLMAGGVGISPMRSMLQTLRDRGDRRHVVLFYAGRDAHIPYRAEIESLRGGLNLDVVPVLEAPPEDWTGERGYLTMDVLRRHLPRQFKRYHYFVCGPPPMMVAVEAMLLDAGVPASSIDSEHFNLV